MAYDSILTNVDYCRVPFLMNNVLFHFNPTVMWIRTHLACFDSDHSSFIMFDNAHKMMSFFQQWTTNLSSLIWTMEHILSNGRKGLSF
jgi:hypothetical protein